MMAASLSSATRKPLAATGFSVAIQATDLKDIAFGGGGQDRPGYRYAVSITASARDRTSSIGRVPLSSASSRVRVIMVSNARL